MLWYKIGNRYIDLNKVKEIGYSSSDTIYVVFINENEVNYYLVEDAEKEMERFDEFILAFYHLNKSPWNM